MKLGRRLRHHMRHDYAGEFFVRVKIGTNQEAECYRLPTARIEPDGDFTMYACPTMYEARLQYNHLHRMGKWPVIQLIDADGRRYYHDPDKVLVLKLSETYTTAETVPPEVPQ